MNSYRAYMDSICWSEKRQKALVQAVMRCGKTGQQSRILRRVLPLAACLGIAAAASLLWPRQGRQPQRDTQSWISGGFSRQPDEKVQNGPMIEAVDFADGSRLDRLAADLALPDGYFFEDMTPEQIARMLGSGDELSYLLGWDDYDIAGCVTYGGDGSVYQAAITGTHADGTTFTMQLSPGKVPPTCVVTSEEAETEIGGVPMQAVYHCYDRDGDGVDEYVYEFSMLPGAVGIRFEAAGENSGSTERLATLAANWCARWTDGLALEHLTPQEIPEWRSDRLDSEAQARGEDLGAYLPAAIPQGFAFDAAWRELGQNRDYLSVYWYAGMREIQVTVSRPQEQPAVMDTARPELYDTRLYEIPWADSVPDEAREAGFDDPAYAQRDLTADVLDARLYQVQDAGDAAGYRLCMSIWHEDGVLVSYRAKGLTRSQAAALVLGN